MIRRTPPTPNCPLDVCLKFLSSAWTTRIFYYLRHGPRRFGDLRRDLEGISTKVLTTRLREMEAQGVITRKTLPADPPQVEYELTTLGHEFEPVLETMIKVAAKLQKRYGIS